jgi:hypothetical protein
VGNALFWLVWFEVLAILGSVSRERPPEPGSLPNRTRLLSLAGLFALAIVGREHHSILIWVAWFLGLALLLAMEARSGALRPKSSLLDHPTTGAAPLSGPRRIVAVFTLVAFVLLFMWRPFSM